MKISRQKWYEQIGYKPRSWQRLADAAGDSGVRYIATFAFPRAGKSLWAARHVEPFILQPDNHGWIVAPTYALGSKEFGYIYNDLAETGWLKYATSVHNDMRGGNMRIDFKWGSFVQVVSADNPTSLRAEELDWLILAEASALQDGVYERHLFARTEKRKARILIPTTPKGYNWVYNTFRVPSLERLPDKQWGGWESGYRPRIGTDPNNRYDSAFWSTIVSSVPDFGEVLEESVYDAESVERGRRLLPWPIFAEQFGGDFAAYAGLIYPFDPLEHVCDPFPIPDEWTHVVGWDHGSNNPTAILFGSYAPDGTLYWWNEIYTTGFSAAEFASQVRAVLGLGKTLSACVIDPSAKQVRIELSRVGITTTIPHDKLIEARITRLTSLMREGKFKAFRGRVPNLISEAQSWEWDDDNPGKPRPKQKCHALDAAGYASLATVALPSLYNLQDPDMLPGEPADISLFWKPVREFWRKQEEEASRKELEDNIYDDPFEESGLRPEPYTTEG